MQELKNKIRYAGPKALELKSSYKILEKKTHSTFVKPILDEAEKIQKDIKLADQNLGYYETKKEENKQIAEAKQQQQPEKRKKKRNVSI